MEIGLRMIPRLKVCEYCVWRGDDEVAELELSYADVPS